LKSDVFLATKFNQLPPKGRIDVNKTPGVSSFAPQVGVQGANKRARAKSSYGKHSKPFMQTNNLMKAPGLDTIKPVEFTKEEHTRNNMYSNLIQKRPKHVEEISPRTKGSR